MAETTPSQANLTAVANLEEALAHPEPMCLAMLEVHLPGRPGNGSANDAGDDDAGGNDRTVEDEVMEEAHRRLRDTLRDYDELTRLDTSRFILVLRTLADASILGGRMHSLYQIMTRPYIVDVEVFLGAAVRVPQETSTQLVDRVDQAVILARSSSDGGPVML